MSKKTGTLSNEAKAFIEENSASMRPEDIAAQIGKSVNTVLRYIDKEGLSGYGETYEEKVVREIKNELHNDSFWSAILDNYTPKEVEIFESKWIGFIRQFENDVTETEKLQIHKYLTLFLLRERAVKKQTLFHRTLESVTTQLNDEKKLPPDQRNKELIDRLANTIQSLTAESKNITNEVRDLSKQEIDIEKSLKGTRDQRVQFANDATKNFSSVMELLQRPEIINQIGMNIELHRRSAEKARESIAVPHKFLNGMVDLPLLTSDTVEGLDLQDYE